MTKKTNKNYYFIKKPTVFLLTMLSSSVAFSGNLDYNELFNKNLTYDVALKEVTGVVTDTNGQPLPGATVFIKGTNKGTQTDFDGKFVLDVQEGEIIAVSYVGYETQEVLFNGQQTLNVSLQISTDALTEVVVVGYSSKSTRDITGSVEVVDVEELQKTAPLSIEQALQGQASGVTVSSQGGPGGGAAVRIRGFSSLNGADPLYVIDGTPTSSGINELNPTDIESIQVLKDAASSAIYGNRAANGVIIVTTKKGKRNQKATLTVNTWSGIDFIPKGVLPDLASPQQIADAEFLRRRNSDVATNHAQYGGGDTPVLPNFIIPARASTVDLSTYDFNDNRISRANKNGTDWFGAYFNPALVHNTNLGISGGSETANFYAGLGILDQDGVGLETYYRRYNARFNSQFSVNNKLRFGQNLNFTYSQSVQFDSGDDNDLDNAIISLYRIHPLIPIYDVRGNFSGSRASELGNGENPIATAIQGRDNKDNRFRTTGNFYGEYDLFKQLTFKTNFGIDVYNSEARKFNPIRRFDDNVKSNNDLEESLFVNTNYTWFNTLMYKATLSDKHKLTALVGSEFVKFRNKSFTISGRDLPSDTDVDSQFIDTSLETTREVSGTGSENALFSVFGNIDYKFDDKYIVSATLRRDASSKFGGINNKDLRVGYFPSFSLGWRISNESFLYDSDIVSNLLFKGGYGEIGNDNIPAGLDLDANESNALNSGIFGGVVNRGVSLAILGNNTITWETKKTTNVGFDLTLLNKIDIGFEYFSTITEDVLNIVAEDPSVLGNINTRAANAGEISNKGFDLNLGFRDETSSGFQYKIAANISVYKNEVELIDPVNDEAQIFGTNYGFEIGTINNTTVGQPISSFFGFNYQGIDQTTGRAIFEDLNNDGRINGNDRQFIGNPHPDFTYGLNFSGNYKSFDFSMLFQGSQGNDIYNLTRVFTDTSIFQGAKSIDYVNAWTPTNTGATIPQLTTVSEANTLERQASSFFVEDGSYFRLKNIQIGYTLPKAFTNNLKLDRLRVYLQGKNLLTFTNYSGLDPEISLRSFNNNADAQNINSNNVRSLGVDTGAYPISRSIIFGINVSL